jgi:sulfonate transport system substrate-binding protein
MFGIVSPSAAQPRQQKFTEWGWPLPYEKISDASVKWLKEKGWWPLKVGYQIDSLTFLLAKKGLLQARGIECEATPFLNGPPMLEAFVAGRLQTFNAGNFPTTTMIDKGFPMVGIAHSSVNGRHATLVPVGSPITSAADLKLEKLGHMAIIGLPVGSSAEFYFRTMCKVQGIQIGKDVTIKDMSPPDIMLLPKGVDAFAIYEPTPYQLTTIQKRTKIIDVDWPYMMYLGYLSVQRDLLQVPDVMQAISDAYCEANLMMRQDIVGITKLIKAEHVIQKVFPWETLIYLNSLYTYYKPTFMYIYPEFDAKALSHVASFLSETGRTRTLVTADRYKSYFRSDFMANTFKKLGWAMPKVPVWIPKNWKGEPDRLPYPPYYSWPLKSEIGKPVTPQPFPEPGDLVAPWYFKGKLYNP